MFLKTRNIEFKYNFKQYIYDKKGLIRYFQVRVEVHETNNLANLR